MARTADREEIVVEIGVAGALRTGLVVSSEGRMRCDKQQGGARRCDQK